MSISIGRQFEIAVSDSSSVFAYVNQLSDVFANESQKKKDKNEIDNRIEIVEKVCQQRIVFSSSSVRRLVIEMYSVFDKTRTSAVQDKALDTMTTCQFSRLYRSVLLNAAISHSSSEFLTDFSLWSLYEKLYFNRGDGSICADLISWGRESFTFVKGQIEKSAEEFEPGNGMTTQSEEYWRGVAVAILTCHFYEAAQLLSVMAGDECIDRFIDCLEAFDPEYLVDEAKADKVMEWKERLRESIQYSTPVLNQNIVYLTKLLLGEDNYIRIMARKILDDWWTLLPFFVVAKNPYATYAEFVELADSCREIFQDQESENDRQNDVFWCLVARDEGRFYQLLMNNPWLSVHLVDLIQKTTMDPELEQLRKSLILNYSSTLILHSDLWEIGFGYAIACGSEGLLRLETHIEGMHIEDDAMAEKLYEICEDNDLRDAKSCVMKTMTYRYLKIEEWGNALGWALKSGCKKTIDIAVSNIISSCNRSDLAHLIVLDSLASHSVLSLPSLTFLYSYQKFVKMIYDGLAVDCVQHLIPLIMMQDVPTAYYSDLFDYLISIIKEDNGTTGIRFPKEILYELSSFLATFTVDKMNELNDNYVRKIKKLKKMVMLKLAESIMKGITF